MFGVVGTQISDRYAANMAKLGIAATGKLRVDKFMANSRRGGDWRQTTVAHGGTEAKLYFDRNKFPKQARLESLSRNLHKILKEQYPTRSDEFRIARREGLVYLGWDQIARVVFHSH